MSIVTVQSAVSEKVAETLRLHLTESEQRALTSHHTNNPRAYEFYVRGRYFWNKRTSDDYLKAIEYFNQALALDANYAEAYAGLADAYALLACQAPVDLRPERMRMAKDYARRALSIDETLAGPHSTLGFIGWHYDWDWESSDREFKRAIELNPSYATAHQWYAFLLVRVNRFDEAIAEMKQARDLDPLSFMMHQDLADLLFYSRRYDEAIEAARKTLELAPDNMFVRGIISLAYYRKGSYQEFINSLQEMINLTGRKPDELRALAAAYFHLNRKDEGQKIIKELRQRRESIALDPDYPFWAYGKTEGVFEWLEKTSEFEGLWPRPCTITLAGMNCGHTHAYRST